MFHKENSSIEIKNTTNSNHYEPKNTKPKKGQNGTGSSKKNSNGGGSSTTITTTKVKDVPLRKSDRRELLQRAKEFFGIINNVEEKQQQQQQQQNHCYDNDNHQNNDANLPNCQLSNVASETCHKVKTVDNVELTINSNNNNYDYQAHASRMLENTFLQGMLYSRQLKLIDCKVTLYYRSPTNDNIVNEKADDDQQHPTVWPYRVSNQCIWIFLDQGVSVNDQYHLPGLALVSVIIPIINQNLCSILPSKSIVSSSSSPPSSSGSNTSRNNHLLPIVQVHPQVSSYLVRGANLMRAGIRTIPLPPSTTTKTITSTTSKQHSATIFENNNRRVVLICIQGNPQPFAVGLLHPNIRSINDVGVGTSGVGVTVITCYGDDLWRHQHGNHFSLVKPIQSKSSQNDITTINPIGGAPYDDGHYGNVGFIDGNRVVPIGTTSSATIKTNEIDDEYDIESTSKLQDQSENDERIQQGGHSATSCISADLVDPNNQSSDSTGPVNRIDTIITESENITIATTDSNNIVPNENSSSNHEDNMQQIHQQHPIIQNDDDRTISHDQILHLSVLAALMKISPMKKQVLPMPVATFYANYVLPNRPPNTTIQLKLTTYKKFGRYIAEHSSISTSNNNNNNNNSSDENLLLVGPAKQGGGGHCSTDPMAMLIDFNKRHPDVRSYIQENKQQLEDDIAATNAVNNSKKMILLELYIIPHHFVSLLRLNPDDVKAVYASSDERKNTGFLTSKEMKDILDNYIEREGLVQPDFLVQLDGSLTDALYGKKSKQGDNNTSAPPERISRKDLASMWRSKMESAYALVTEASIPGRPNQILKLGRGKYPTVMIDVGRGKNANSYVTRVRGMEQYGVVASVLAKDIAIRFACSATIDEKPETNGRPALKAGENAEIVVQGNWADELEALLLSDESLTDHGGARGSEYHLPKNSIEVTLRKGVPQRKKRASNVSSKSSTRQK